MPCAQAEDSGLLGPPQSPNWVKVCLISTVVFLPVSIVPRVEKCLGLSVGDRILCLVPVDQVNDGVCPLYWSVCGEVIEMLFSFSKDILDCGSRYFFNNILGV